MHPACSETDGGKGEVEKFAAAPMPPTECQPRIPHGIWLAIRHGCFFLEKLLGACELSDDQTDRMTSPCDNIGSYVFCTSVRAIAFRRAG
jgi:hypothetical protein